MALVPLNKSKPSPRRKNVERQGPTSLSDRWFGWADAEGVWLSVAVAAGFFAVAAGILMFRPSVAAYRPGQYAASDVLARVDFQYNDPQALVAARTKARLAAPRVYQSTGDAWGRLETDLLTLPDRVSGVRADQLADAAARGAFDNATLAQLQAIAAVSPRPSWDLAVRDFIDAVRSANPIILPDADRLADRGRLVKVEGSDPVRVGEDVYSPERADALVERLNPLAAGRVRGRAVPPDRAVRRGAGRRDARARPRADGRRAERRRRIGRGVGGGGDGQGEHAGDRGGRRRRGRLQAAAGRERRIPTRHRRRVEGAGRPRRGGAAADGRPCGVPGRVPAENPAEPRPRRRPRRPAARRPRPSAGGGGHGHAALPVRGAADGDGRHDPRHRLRPPHGDRRRGGAGGVRHARRGRGARLPARAGGRRVGGGVPAGRGADAEQARRGRRRGRPGDGRRRRRRRADAARPAGLRRAQRLLRGGRGPGGGHRRAGGPAVRGKGVRHHDEHDAPRARRRQPPAAPQARGRGARHLQPLAAGGDARGGGRRGDRGPTRCCAASPRTSTTSARSTRPTTSSRTSSAARAAT